MALIILYSIKIYFRGIFYNLNASVFLQRIGVRLSIFLIIIGLFQSCGLSNYFNETNKITTSYHSREFELCGDRIVLNTLIEEDTASLILDLGSNDNLLWDSTFTNNSDKVFSRITGRSASGGRVRVQRATYEKFRFLNVEVDNPIFSYLTGVSAFQELLDRCKISGLLSGKYFDYEDNVILLDFDSLTITVSDADVSTDAFVEVESRIDIHGIIWVKLLIGNENSPNYYMFDTGFNGNVRIKDFKNRSYVEEIKYFGVTGYDVSGHLVDTVSYFDSSLRLIGSSYSIDNQRIALSPYTEQKNRVGIKFIQQFNWIVDFKNEKVYFSKNSNNVVKRKMPNHIVRLNEDKIIITAINTNNNSNHSLGKVVVDNSTFKLSSEELYAIVDSINFGKLEIEHFIEDRVKIQDTLIRDIH